MNISTEFNEGANFDNSINTVSVKMMDINGDGLLDHVLRIPGVGIYWKKNITGQVGLLKGIELPQGGTVSLYYAESYGTEDSPSFKYVMSKVVYDDNCEEQHGYHTLTTEYEYEDAYYDRDIKENYGFETVRTYSGVDYNGNYEVVQTDTYFNRDYYSKGLLKSTELRDSNNNLLRKTEN